jgi:hypothetical protein
MYIKELRSNVKYSEEFTPEISWMCSSDEGPTDGTDKYTIE